LLQFSTRDEQMTLSFTSISPLTAGSFDITAGLTGETRTVNWNSDPAVVLADIQQAFTELVHTIDQGATATVTQISPTQYTITFGGTLSGQNLTPNPAAFQVSDNINPGGVTLNSTT